MLLLYVSAHCVHPCSYWYLLCCISQVAFDLLDKSVLSLLPFDKIASMNTNFQKLLDSFKGNIEFKELIEKLRISPDEYISIIETDQGTFYIFETDYISDFDYIVEQVRTRTEKFSYFVEAKLPPEKFEDIPAAKYYTSPEYYPADFEQFKKYVTFNDYFTFLIKK
jgi:hypothetical protein